MAWGGQSLKSPTTPPCLPPRQSAVLQGKAQCSMFTMVRLSNVVVYHWSSRKGYCSKITINTRLAYWTLLSRKVRVTTKKKMKNEPNATLNFHISWPENQIFKFGDLNILIQKSIQEMVQMKTLSSRSSRDSRLVAILQYSSKSQY